MKRKMPPAAGGMDQFNNPASIEAHYAATGLEIFQDTDGKVSHVVVALGTSGTAMTFRGKGRPSSRRLAVTTKPLQLSPGVVTVVPGRAKNVQRPVGSVTPSSRYGMPSRGARTAVGSAARPGVGTRTGKSASRQTIN